MLEYSGNDVSEGINTEKKYRLKRVYYFPLFL